MTEYFWIITIEARLPTGLGSAYSSGTLTAEPHATRQDLFRAALAKARSDAGIPPGTDAEVKFFSLEPNILPRP